MVKHAKSAQQLLREQVYRLTDGDLVLRLKQADPEKLNAWEKKFAPGTVEFFERTGYISWKQRKYARAN